MVVLVALVRGLTVLPRPFTEVVTILMMPVVTFAAWRAAKPVTANRSKKLSRRWH